MQFDLSDPLKLGAAITPESDGYATAVVEKLFSLAMQAGASDIHISEVPLLADGSEPVAAIGFRLRVHGQLITLPTIRDGSKSHVMGRVKALAKLITYRRDIPQEGRFTQGQYELRVGTLPTLHGERAVVRIQAPTRDSFTIDQLGLSSDAEQRLSLALRHESGVVVICGPAGSGKTTTAYACLKEIQSTTKLPAGQPRRSISAPRSIVTLEDPVEYAIPGADQSQISHDANYDWELGLKSVLRQDPEVLMIGEIRDDKTAQVVFKAAATGQLVITTLHSRSAADAVTRLCEMGVPAHQIRSSLLFLNCQRLAAVGCDCRENDEQTHYAGTETCPHCAGTGYRGRQLLSETLPQIDGILASAISATPDTARVHESAMELGMQSLSMLRPQ